MTYVDVALHLLGVGKSCLLLRFSDDSFTTSFITTIGSASTDKHVITPHSYHSKMELRRQETLRHSTTMNAVCI